MAFSIFLYQKELANEKRLILQSTMEHIAHEQKVIENIFRLIGTDLFVLASRQDVSETLSGQQRGTHTRSLEQELLAFAGFKEIYDQIRLLDANGQEQLRINHRDGIAKVVPAKQLQNKKERYYFTDTMQVDANHIYISPFDLNMENGIVEQPLKPVIRLGMPIMNRQGGKSGIIILNYLGRHLLDALADHDANSSEITMLINADGYWLKGLRPEDEWGFMFTDRQDKTMASRFPEVWSSMQQGNGYHFSEQGLFSFGKVRPLRYFHPRGFSVSTPGEGLAWYLATFIPAGDLFPVSQRLRQRLLWVNPGALLLWGLAAWFIAITAHRKRLAERALIEKEISMREVVNTALDGIITVNGDGIIESFNPAACTIFGYREDEVVGQNINMLIPIDFRQQHDRHMEQIKVEDGEKLKRPREMKGSHRNGSIIPLEICIGVIQKKDGWLFTAIFRDITERKKLLGELKHMAVTDELTGVYNRFYFNDRLEQGYKHALRYQHPLSLMVLDIDNFKSINDSYGHSAGDSYLSAFANLLTESCRETDTVCRYGGEEFVIMLPETGIEHAEQLATRLLDSIHQLQISHDNTVITTTVSIGIATFDSTIMKEPEDLFKLADAALYRAKGGGKNRFVSA